VSTAPVPVAAPLLQQRLDNGLRVVVREDHTAPAVAVNLWYGVGSRHELPGRTGLAHLFEHLMFQGSAHVRSGEHFGLLEPLGASLNATTSFDRTNYFETVPTGALDLALWLEADRMGGLLAALDQPNLDNQRDVVKNERRQTHDNRPYGTAWNGCSLSRSRRTTPTTTCRSARWRTWTRRPSTTCAPSSRGTTPRSTRC